MPSVQLPQTYSMWTRDGVRLDADVYFPHSTISKQNSAMNKEPIYNQEQGRSHLDKTFPVLLMRQPYGRAIASTIVYAHPRWYAAQGYIVVIQDVRGRGTSEGEFDLFLHEVNDGADSIQWAAQLPGSDGKVGMYGFSYQGMTQLHAAQAKPPALKTIAPAMTGYHLYEDWATENGAFCFQLGLVWGLQLAAETARIKKDISTFQALLHAAHNLPFRDPVPAQPEVLNGVDSFFHDWVSSAADSSYWQQRTPQLDEVDLPMLHIGGWFDPYLRGDLRLYQKMSVRSQSLHHFHIGPWTHIPWSSRSGTVDFGKEAISPIDRLQVQWFDAILKGKDALKEQASVCLFEMGRNQWRELSYWPNSNSIDQQGDQTTYHLSSDGLSHIREDSGKLSTNPTGALTIDTIVHDPWNPAPALGGHSAIPAGSFERSTVDARGDVLTYTSEPLTSELRVVGVPEVVCAIAASSPSYDICAVLSRVDTQGNVFNLTQGYRKVDITKSGNTDEGLRPVDLGASDLQLQRVPLHPTCFSLATGECLRLSLSAACFPAYPINPGTGQPLSKSRLIDAQIITLTLAVGADSGSVLKLPVLSN